MKGQINLQVPKNVKTASVELDSTAHAAYVRFSKNKVVKTIPLEKKNVFVSADFDRSGNVVGLELIGVKEFSIGRLIKKAGLHASPSVVENLAKNAKYVLC